MILAIKYEEPSYRQTVKAIEASKVPAIYVHRNPKGIGSLSEAINRGIRMIPADVEFVWIVTNVTFHPSIYSELVAAMLESPELAAICPCYNSDHQFLKQVQYRKGAFSVPFIEFTAPMVRAQILRDHPLDQAMPYAGFDLDWSYRVKGVGHKLGTLQGVSIGHTYIRHIRNRYNVTRLRHRARKAADASTIARLVEKYGENWQSIMQYYQGIAAK